MDAKRSLINYTQNLERLEDISNKWIICGFYYLSGLDIAS